MDATQEELIQAVEQANQGNWIPLTVVIAVLGVVIALLIHIWNNTQKETEKRRVKVDEMLKELTESSVEQKSILSELRTIVKYHEKDIEKLKEA